VPGAPASLAALMAGNARFVAGAMQHPRQDPARREALLGGQHPAAAILGCADSRIAPELIFDCGLGDLFVVRLAGNIPDDLARASLEYAVEHLGTPLLVVLGHSQCGAITAAASAADGSGSGEDPCAERTCAERLAEVLRPAVEEARGGDAPGLQGAGLVDCAARCHARRSAAALRSSMACAASGTPRAAVVAAYYDQASGRVELLDP